MCHQVSKKHIYLFQLIISGARSRILSSVICHLSWECSLGGVADFAPYVFMYTSLHLFDFFF